MWCTLGDSWQNKRPHFVAESLKVIEHLRVDTSIVPTKQAANIFADHPSWSKRINDVTHIRPEVSRVVVSPAESGLTVGLTREPSAEDIASRRLVCRELLDIVEEC